MKKWIIILSILFVGYCTVKPSYNAGEPDSEIARKIRIETARDNLVTPTIQYVNDGLTNVDFVNNGISVWQLTSRIINKYDQDKDGILNVNEDTFLRIEKQTHIPDESVIKTESRGLLFMDADKVGDANGQVTVNELLAYISTFDVDGDGKLTTGKSIFKSIFGGGSEWERFEANHEERIKYNEK